MHDHDRHACPSESAQEAGEPPPPELGLLVRRIAEAAARLREAEGRAFEIAVGTRRDHHEPRAATCELRNGASDEAPAVVLADHPACDSQVDERTGAERRDRRLEMQSARRAHERLGEMARVRVADQDGLAPGSGDAPRALIRSPPSERRLLVAAAEDVRALAVELPPPRDRRRLRERARRERQSTRGEQRRSDADARQGQGALALPAPFRAKRRLDVAVREPGRQQETQPRQAHARGRGPERPGEDDQRPVPEIPAVRKVADPDQGDGSRIHARPGCDARNPQRSGHTRRAPGAASRCRTRARFRRLRAPRPRSRRGLPRRARRRAAREGGASSGAARASREPAPNSQARVGEA